MNFEENLKRINVEKLKEFLSGLKTPCYETELMRASFQDKDVLKCDSLELYQNHFVLFYVLYKLQEEYYKEDKYLNVHFMRTFLSDYPEYSKCRFYDEHTGLFCRAEVLDTSGYCAFHNNKVGEYEIEQLSAKYFYYDIENYSKLDRDTAEQFINGAWEILINYKKIEESFQTLEIPESYDLEIIKKQFRILAKKYHPDLGESTHKKFNDVNRAYRYLMQTIPRVKKK
ncbi:MAG TPA: DnaJ domain-containing protein [Spirochaetota bacterium]|jgi:hypothetical protein|nr:MAG: Chaperone protein DnaJ [Spirochaetes bacterium ADurb.Bin133]HNZ27731.1 DnaJ domain-containing protein [Spirochaetota bacterium]HPY87260.1 DnaJ domain-containing protein [Spirochaetota bacterium]HQB61030.1 DnaJ domain-containing protein [Spirochaetota bacterium]